MKGYCDAMKMLCESDNPNRLKFCQAYQENCITNMPIDITLVLTATFVAIIFINFNYKKMRNLTILAIVLITLVACNKEEQFCEVVDYHNNEMTNGWEEVNRLPSSETEEQVIFDRYKDGYRHKRVIECANLY